MTRALEQATSALADFCQEVAARFSASSRGQPEDQLRGPFETLVARLCAIHGRPVVPVGEVGLDRLGRPDYAIESAGLLIGYVELKAPGEGAETSRFRGRNREQAKRFAAIPNLLYTDGNEWALYHSGERQGAVVRLQGDVSSDGSDAVGEQDAGALIGLVERFLAWEPEVPIARGDRIDLKKLAKLLAPLCRMLRDDVSEALGHEDSPLIQLARDWRQLLFPTATDDQFADSYAQTVTFALLLARAESSDPLTLDSAEQQLAAEHGLLSRALQVLTDPRARREIATPLRLLERVIGAVPSLSFAGAEDPWLYFYEDFLAEYDPELRKNAGAYYTPAEVVRAQVRLVDDILGREFDRPLGFADPGVLTLDPAVGTGTYLLGVVRHALDRIEHEQGAGAVAGQATSLAANLYGFELLVGPYAVSELRVSRALQDRGGTLPSDGTQVYLTDTLESPDTPPPALPFYLQPIADQHARALAVKQQSPIMVCLGNPPYDRHDRADETNRAETGGWVRHGDAGDNDPPILDAFLQPARDAGHGIHLKNLYNLYVYFWRWAFWKVFERGDPRQPGVVSFITASSFLDGDAFCGMREHLRRQCDAIWVIDLGGEGRGTRKEENVFNIQTPVAIAMAVRYGETDTERPARARYVRIAGSRADKLAQLDAVTGVDSLAWQECPADWHAPLRATDDGPYFDWPLLVDLFPWQHSGVKSGRTWVVASTAQVLEDRWKILSASKLELRAKLFKNSPSGRKISDSPPPLSRSTDRPKKIENVTSDDPTPQIIDFAFRSFDRQYVIGDSRFIDRPYPDMWLAYSSRQVYLTTLLNHPLGEGPALTAAAHIPDLHHFRGSYGAKEVIPLFRDADATEPNLRPGLLEVLSRLYGTPVSAEDFAAYVYGVLAQPAFTERYGDELASRELRVPITRDAGLFAAARDTGARLLWLHTYAERYATGDRPAGRRPLLGRRSG